MTTDTLALEERKDKILAAYYITCEILECAIFAEHDLKQRLLNIATSIFCQDIFGLSSSEKSLITFRWEDLPFRVIRVPPENLWLPPFKEDKADAQDFLTGLFPYLQNFYENFSTFRPSSIQGTFQNHWFHIGALRERFSFDEVKQFVFDLWRHCWFAHSENAGLILHILYRDNLLGTNTNTEIGGVIENTMSQDEYKQRRVTSGNAITLLEPYFERLGEKNKEHGRNLQPLWNLARVNIQDCERNLAQMKQHPFLSDWFHFIYLLIIPYTLSFFILKEIYYSVDDISIRRDIDREMTLPDECRGDIADMLRNPYLHSNVVIEKASKALTRKGEAAAKRALKYFFEGRIFLPLEYFPRFEVASALYEVNRKIEIVFDGASAGHMTCWEESKHHTESAHSKTDSLTPEDH